ncbi:MAG TPA: inositol monophosphatase family protein [Bryobacteraceae bacterium]|nr:inositol monophosphatase family protein [Bryobacteraceae bacterium]
MEYGTLEKAVEIAREAGALIANYYERRVPFESKGEFDLVTAADRASEKLIVERLRAHFPSHGIVAEEGGGYESPSEYQWFVDPLDGTTNFAHSFPLFNVTMALAKGDDIVTGVVFDPMKNEMFTAERGSGAYLNNRRIHVSGVKRLAESLSSTGFPSRKRQHNANIYFYYQLAMASHGVRRTGTAAIDMAYIASGRADFFWEFGLKPWDMAAGVLLVQEAGGRVSDMHGAKHSVTKSDSVLADNGLLHGEALEIFGELFHGKMRHPLPQLAGISE